MIELKHEDGLINLILPDKHAAQALALFQTALAESRIAEVEERHTYAAAGDGYEYPASVKFLSVQDAGDVIVSYVMDKAERTYGNRYPYQMQRFFRALEKEIELDINREHKKRLYCSGRPHMRGHKSYRKIDTAIELLGADEVYKFAKSFNFVANE